MIDPLSLTEPTDTALPLKEDIPHSVSHIVVPSSEMLDAAIPFPKRLSSSFHAIQTKAYLCARDSIFLIP